jgi:hypothetical protein
MSDDNDYDSDNLNEEYEKINNVQKLNIEKNKEKKLKIANFYRKLLYYEPEFIGIKNISSFEFLDIVHNIYNCFLINYGTNKIKYKFKLNHKDHNLTNDQKHIFNNLFNDLKLKLYIFEEFYIDFMYNIITQKIFNKIYFN